ncbi:cellulose binding domain-containing protein [Fibrella forsythiae]|uniref:Ig domain-containing protein n=1 Tax=Fibrella forsythiae TaxID=2817061 RepID=A0ABS3JII1_9BACT|nr:cellulose binding domain-containing protein [Fibrella forsythiae]MBO0949819.1 putative Ig domain-containing protein [Fibrella forsythiae]
MSQLYRIALPGIVALCWLVSSVQAQVGPAPANSYASAGRRTQQIVDSLQRLTQPGYYRALLTAPSTSSPNARIAATDLCDSYLCKSPTPTNTAPISTTNADQNASVNTPFSYTVNAFTDAETPNSLTYSASFSAANGLSFNPATRVISGTPTAPGSISVTIKATDPGSLSATTSFVINVTRRVGGGGGSLSLTLTATPTRLLTTEATSLSAAVTGGTAGVPYSYTFSGPGTIRPSGNTAQVSALPAGVQTFTVVAANGDRTVTGTVSVTVSAPTPTTALTVLHRDVDNYADNNAIQPLIELQNQGNTALPLSAITLRYYLTVEGAAALSNLSINYAQVGNGNVRLRYVPLSPAQQGASGYVEFSFTDGAGSLAAGASSGPIQAYFAKSDYAGLNELDDYSYALVRNQLVGNLRITAYYNGVLVAGVEPGSTTQIRALRALTESKNGPSATQINTYLTIRNEGNVGVNYSELKARYYFTADGTERLLVEVDEGNVRAQLVKLPQALGRADYYLEITFLQDGQLAPGASTGRVRYRISKPDGGRFDQTNDYSYQEQPAESGSNSRVVVYVGNERVWGTEPGAGVRLAVDEPRVPLTVTVLGNPVSGATINLDIRGAEGQPLRIQLMDVTGRAVSERLVERAGSVERQQLPVGQQPAGILLLRVSTPDQNQTVKVIH